MKVVELMSETAYFLNLLFKFVFFSSYNDIDSSKLKCAMYLKPTSGFLTFIGSTSFILFCIFICQSTTVSDFTVTALHKPG